MISKNAVTTESAAPWNSRGVDYTGKSRREPVYSSVYPRALHLDTNEGTNWEL